ncbi:putative E3 ubiquitin-protein ligase TOM1-like protein [Podospora fimiseda]|uniref:HECT-type E3 ubiquitin transferase n=1 Tax=Podospora fimiseda TaxID=252190 RepID=A0AAN7BR67_9PEZI|nr:putative E3 ubiquitin-protein ligase TOM1-like protein [Podospora fimiseda]
MGKITKTMQTRHKETLSPWLKEFVEAATVAPLPLIPKKLSEFPSRWPFPRGDLYHWIPLLNRFDNILEAFCTTYGLTEGFQSREFTCELLLNEGAPVEYNDDPWNKQALAELGYKEDGDVDLIISICEFSTLLMKHSGNRSIYPSSNRINDLLNSTSLKLVLAALGVGLENAIRYHVSHKRLPGPHSRQFISALLANHYDIELDRVNTIAQPFVKTPVSPVVRLSDAPPTTPSASASKVKDKPSTGSHKNVASMYANDLVSLVAPEAADEGSWNGWGDLKVVYYPKTDTAKAAVQEVSTHAPSGSTVPMTPTPLRRSSTSISQTPGAGRSEDSPSNRHHVGHDDDYASSGPKSFEIRQSVVQSTSVHDLLKRCPEDMPKGSRYEFLHRLRICKALLGSSEDRQLALAVRLMAVTNLTYIYQDPVFAEKVLKQDNDEPRRYQLIYQLAELIHPSADGAANTPLWLQAIAFAALLGIVNFHLKLPDVISALNANVNHGVLMYVIRKAVASMKEDPSEEDDGKATVEDRWRTNLFKLIEGLALARGGTDMSSSGLVEVLIEVLKFRNKTAERNWHIVLNFLDQYVYCYQGALGAFSSATGLDAIADLIIHAVTSAKELVKAGKGTQPQFHAYLVDYEIPFYHQQAIRYLLKFIHHTMTSSSSFGTNIDRLLRNLVDNSALLNSLRLTIEERQVFGSVVWTNSATLLNDFINNDPTSFPAIGESGMVQSFLRTLTGVEVVLPKTEDSSRPDANPDEGASSPDYSDESLALESDDRQHPPTFETLSAPRSRPLAQGILAATEAINTVPSVLNGICLNNAGLKMVVSSGALDSFLEIFESPEHVHILTRSLDTELVNNIAASFDELARHHPRLRPTISNAIIDLTARVVHLAHTKSTKEGWGAKLLVNDPSGESVTADESLLGRLAVKGKGKAIVADTDVEMADAPPTTAQSQDSSKKSESEKNLNVYKDISPYVQGLSAFLSHLFLSNSTLRNNFVKGGGIELLLDLIESPSLPANFDETQPSRTLATLLSQVLEVSPILGLPSVLQRIHKTIDDLEPLMTWEDEYPVFGRLIAPGALLQEDGEFDPVAVQKVSHSTGFLRALIRLHGLMRGLYNSFPISSRHATVTIPTVNVYDLHVSLIERLGPLLRVLAVEAHTLAAFVPKSWNREKFTGDELEVAFLSPPTNGTSEQAQAPNPPVSGSTETLPLLPGPTSQGSETNNEKTARITEEYGVLSEETTQSNAFKNFQAVHRLLHSTVPEVLPFFQTLGKALFSRRVDPYIRSHHLDVAEALANTVLQQLKLSQSAKEFRNWATVFHMLRETLLDPTRLPDRAGTNIILPVLIAFKEHGGFEILNTMLEKFADDICNCDSEDSKHRQAAFGVQKILEVYFWVVGGKNISDAWNHFSSFQRSEGRGKDLSHQFVVELRMTVLPVVRKLWESELAEKARTPALSKIIDILQTIAAADFESSAYRKSDKIGPSPVFKNRVRQHFPWASNINSIVKTLVGLGYDQDLALEATYRANGKVDDAQEYCRAHKSEHGNRLAGNRCKIPESEAYKPPPSPKVEPVSDPMAIDNLVNPGQPELGDDLGDQLSDDSSDTSNDSSSSGSASREGSNAPVAPTTQEGAPASDGVVTSFTTKEDLDKERAELSKDLIDRCLDVLRAHPDSVFEISDLVQNMILKTGDEEKRTEVGEVLANALMSFALDDENDKKANGPSIAAYAHLLSLLLQDRPFFKATLASLKQNISDYLGFLKVAPASSNEYLPPWIPYILLIFETLLLDDEQIVDVKWKAPAKETDEPEQPIWTVKEDAMSEDDRSALLTAIMDILPRIGKEEAVAVSVLRIMVILTRDHAVAKTVGEKRNLQRLFVMAKQLCSGGSTSLNRSHISDNIMIILRHIVEDEDIIRQVMEAEIRQVLMATRHPSRLDISTYMRHLSNFILRSPKLFVETTTRLIKIVRWQQPPSNEPHHRLIYNLMLKPSASSDEKTLPKDSSLETAVQATEDLTMSDVKPSTESADKEMTDASKTPFEVKRPVLENPDGVVHFLLCELLNYREVEDKEPSSQILKEQDKSSAKDTVATAGDTPRAELEATPAPADFPEELDGENRKWDKKTSKSQFKAEEHPIFVYRCFLLNCLTELLQSFTRAKVEFINFKRSAPIQSNTPIKPRSSILNYLLHDLICFNPNSNSTDPVVSKKKLATASQASNVLVALVARTGEKVFERPAKEYEYDDEADLLFVRRFVLDTVLRAYKEAATPGERFDIRYPKMVSLAELMSQMLGDKEKDQLPSNPRGTDKSNSRSQLQLKRLMYEKGYLNALTASIADVDLTYPDVKRTIRYILRVLRTLTKTAVELSELDILPATTADHPDDDLVSASSMSELDDEREETPDLYRNSTLGMLEPGREDDYDSEEEDDDDEEMYDEEVYEDELDYGDEMSQDEEDNPSDEDDEELGEMGDHMEGLPGAPGVVEVIMGEDDEDDDDMDEDDEDEPSDEEDDEDDMGSEDMEDIEDQVDITNEEGNAVVDDGDWESATDEADEEDEEEFDYEAEAQDLQEAHAHAVSDLDHINQLLDYAAGQIDPEDIDGEEVHDFDDHYLDDGAEDEDEEDEDDLEEDEVYFDQGRPRDDLLPGLNMPSGLGWDIAVETHPRMRPAAFRGHFGGMPPFAFGGHGGRDPLGHGRLSTTIRPRELVFEAEARLLHEALGIQRPGREMMDLMMLQHLIRGTNAVPTSDFRSYLRGAHGRVPAPSSADDNRNPLLLAGHRLARNQSPADREHSHGTRLTVPFSGPHVDNNTLAMINHLMSRMPIPFPPGQTVNIQFTGTGSQGEIRHVSLPLPLSVGGHTNRWDPSRRTEVYSEPAHAIQFTVERTAERWAGEAKMIFGYQYHDKAAKLYNAILGALAPEAIKEHIETKAREEEKRKLEEERKKLEEKERLEREAKEAAEKLAKQQKEAEARERQAREQAQAEAEAARQAAELAEQPASQPQQEPPQAMEGVESHAAESTNQQPPAAPTERILTTIRGGETVDVTDLGIDPDYLAALPEEFREEVIAQTLTARRSQAREQAAVEGENTEVFQEFLEALPDELREEIVAQERQDRRRRERDEHRRQQAEGSGQDVDMDTASILLTFPPELRQQVLMEQGEDLMDRLPPDIAAEARNMIAARNQYRAPPAVVRSSGNASRPAETSVPSDSKPPRRTVVQMLDKAGVATLLRLMFITQHPPIRSHLFGVFVNVCENRQNRLEVVSTLLQILQDGSTDMDAVERSFNQLSVRAKQFKEKDSKTPQSLKRTFTNISTNNHVISNSEVSPLLIVQQCLDLLQDLAHHNPHIPSLFLTEHETVASTLKRSLSRKGKGKDVNNKAQKYAINSLLGLLDRSLVMESSTVMQLLADLLNKVTYPLQALEQRRRKDAEEEKKKAEEKAKESKAEASSESANQESADASAAQQSTQGSTATATEEQAGKENAQSESSSAKDPVNAQPEEKKVRQLTPPTIPDHNLMLVVNIFVARECSSKTFQNTIATIKHLSNIPGAKAIFGQELVRQARALSENIVSDLNDLLPHISKAESGTEIQGVALAKFSPGASEQNKLLRVLTALDHLFDSKAKKADGSPEGEETKESTKEDLLGSLYWNPTFNSMWEKLSFCLSAIRQRENMINVATILLPLIESLMVVCKNTTLSDSPGAQAAAQELLLSSPAPENRIAGLFFTFTEEHRRILNELVRHNPKLMSGTFSLLVKNPKVLEFDNKRNYFNRSVHAKISPPQSRQQYPTIQLSVRREHVFHDSFKALFFKAGPEMKFSKLNIRFHGEEGVDAGGVTREWFQVLARQMFDPNYALFIPVSSDRTTFHPNKLSSINDEHLLFFKFIGRIIGKALYEGRLLDCYFSRAVYKRILGKPVSVKDMESFDPDYYKSLVWMLDNDITDIIVETFSVEDDEFGVTKVVDLIENGRNIAVTEENKHEYVRLIVEHKLLTSVKEQMEHFLKGFHDIIPEDLIAIFNEQELELLISGLPDIDVDDWKSNTEYHNYTAASQQIQWFWRAVRSFDKEERAKLLQFVTGTSKVPLNGFKELEGMNGVSRFNIHRDYGNKERLPSSHTCFNQLDLPEYESYETLRAQVLKAITAGSDYFGFA